MRKITWYYTWIRESMADPGINQIYEVLAMQNTNSESNSKYPLTANRAFVIQFSSDTQLNENRLNGRIEHIISGEVSHFSSFLELRQFLGRVLDRTSDTKSP